MTVLKSLLSTFQQSRKTSRKSRRLDSNCSGSMESLEQRLLLTVAPDDFTSNAGADITVYLDFDGHTENSAAWNARRRAGESVTVPRFDFDGNVGDFGDTERDTMHEIFLRVAEDFAPFENVNVTTVVPDNFNVGETIRVAIGGLGDLTTNNVWSLRPYNNAITDGFTDDQLSNTVFVFPQDFSSHPLHPLGQARNGQLGRDIAYGASEAVGIAMGLAENVRGSDATRSSLANSNENSFPRGWRDVWDNTGQDDIAILTNAATNGLTERADDHGDSFALATSIDTAQGTTVSGFVEQLGDVDFFHFSTAGGTATFSVEAQLDIPNQLSLLGNSFSALDADNPGANLNPTLQLFDANFNPVTGQVRSTGTSALGTQITEGSLAAGNYYLAVTDANEYGNLGAYELTLGGVTQPFEVPVPAGAREGSFPSGEVVVYLDFNGSVVTEDTLESNRVDGIDKSFYVPAFDLDGDRTSFSTDEENAINEIRDRVAEDFAPFNINVTTSPIFQFPVGQALQVVIGGDGSWVDTSGTFNSTGFINWLTDLNTDPGSSAYLSTDQAPFANPSVDNMAIAFPEVVANNQEVALAASTIILNSFGVEPALQFDGTGAPTGLVSGNPAFGPLAGDSGSSLRDILRRSDASAFAPQDPISIITNARNQVEFRPDEHAQTIISATSIDLNVPVSETGVIGQVFNAQQTAVDDQDWFRFRARPSTNVTLSVSGIDLTSEYPGVTNPGSNFDPVVQLFKDNGTTTPDLIATAGGRAPAFADGSLSSIQAEIFLPTLDVGEYFVVISNQYLEDFAGNPVNADPAQYGNLGQYTFEMTGALPPSVELDFAAPSLLENAGQVAAFGRVSRPAGTPDTSPIVVTLVSSDTSELSLPQTTVTIPAQQNEAFFTVEAVDDTLLDGDQRVQIDVLVNGGVNAVSFLDILDHETLSVSIPGNEVDEPVGDSPEQVLVTITRSNTDTGPDDHWVAFEDQLVRYDFQGVLQEALTIPVPSGSRPAFETAHDIQVLDDGRVVIFNGTDDGFLTVYNPSSTDPNPQNHWLITPFLDPSDKVNASPSDITAGGITTYNNYVFITDLDNGDGQKGILRFDLNSPTADPVRFGQSAVGARLFAANGTQIQEVNSQTGELIKNISLPTPAVGTRSIVSVAYDGEAIWALTDLIVPGFFGGFFGGFFSFFESELLKIDPDTEQVLETHSLPGINGGDLKGMTILNGKVYINDTLFGSGNIFEDYTIRAYNPATRQYEGSLLSVTTINNIFIDPSIGSIQTDVDADGRLLVIGYPKVGLGSTPLNAQVYEIDPATGRAGLLPGESIPLANGVTFLGNNGVTSVRNVTIGSQFFDHLIYVNGDPQGLLVYDRDGNRIDTNPATGNIDGIPNGGFASNQDIGGGNVPNLVTRDQTFRDVAIGLGDDTLYGLFEDGLGLATYNPETLAQLSSLDLAQQVISITVDAAGNIYGGADNGVVYVFDQTGAVTASYNTGLQDIADIETNVSLSIILSDINGQVLTGTLEDLMANTLTTLENTGATTFVSFARNPDLPTGDLFLELTSSDLTEIGIPIANTTVLIPEGEQSVTVAVDVLPDRELDGTIPVILSGTADHYISESPTVLVHDSEQIGIEAGVAIDPLTNLPFIFENDLPYPSAIRVFRTDLDGPFTVASSTVAVASNQSPVARPVFSKAIADNAVTTSTLEIPSQRTGISDLKVKVNIEHESLADLSIVLISPNNTRVQLIANPEVDGTTLQNTIFDDNAVRSLSLGTAPYSQNFKSSEPLSGFDQENPSGIWTLEVTDSAATGTGVLLDWSLDIDTPSTPLAIVDRDVSLSEIVIPNQNSIITDLDVTVTLQHSFIPDLDVFLVSPSGTRVELFTDLGTNETNMTGAIFDDEAAVRIVDGSAPYTGRFIAEELLSKFDGENPTGRWTLELSDDNITDSGTLIDWSLSFETMALAPATVNVASSDPSEILLSHGSQTEQASVQVVFPAGVSDLYVDLIPQDDQIVDATQQALVEVTSVSLGGFDNGSSPIDVLDVELLTLTLDKTVVSEADGNGAIMATITRTDTALTQPLVVSLVSSDTSEISVQGAVTIPVGESSTTFLINAEDDVDLDGDIAGIQIAATAPGYIDAISTGITVTDQEPRLKLTTLSETVFEDDGTMTITVSRLDASDLSAAQSVTLLSSDPAAVSVPATFLIPIGALSASFVATIHSDNVVDGTQTVSITATDSNTVTPTVSGDTLVLSVLDSESVQISVAAGNESFLELAGNTVTATVTITAVIPGQQTIVTLSNSDLTEVSIPAQVVIPADQTSATFVISAVDDQVIDRDQIVSLTGAAPGYLDGVLNVTVQDHEPPVAVSPTATTEDSTPAVVWAAVDGATRYDLWLNDVSRNIVQLYRLENLPASQPFFVDNFESGSFATQGWTNSNAKIDDLALAEERGSLSAHLNGGADGGDYIVSPTFDLSESSNIWDEAGQTGVQLKYSFQQTGTGESPEATQDLVVSYRNAAGAWIVAERQAGSGPDMTVFTDSVVYLPLEALHANFAIRFDSIGQGSQPNADGDLIEGEYDDWFIDNVELTRFESFIPPQELGIGKYRFWVRAYDNLEQAGAWSAGNDFQVRTRPVFINPTNSGLDAQATAPVLSWTTLVDSSYDLWVNDVTRGISQVIRETDLQTTSFATSFANLPGGTYKAWVRGEAPDGLDGFWSLPVTFTILSSPTGLRPSGATFDRTPEFGWDAVEGADRYYLWVTQNNPFEEAVVVLRDQFVTGTTRLPEQDLADGNYVMWVQAIAEDGTRSRWSAANNFTIGGRPEVVTPSPGSVITGRATFTWVGIDGAERYEFWVNRIDVPVSRFVYDANVTSTSFQLAEPLPAGGTYRVWVRAISEMGERSGWSLPVSFLTASTETERRLDNADEVMVASLPIQRDVDLGRVIVVSPLEELEAVMPTVSMTQPIAPTLVDLQTAEVESEAIAETEEVDTVMADWAASDWANELEVSKSDRMNSTAAMLGLGLAAGRTSRRRKKNED